MSITNLGGGGVSASVANPWLVIKKSAAESVTSSAAVQLDNHLVFAVEANSTYVVEYTLHCTGGLALGGFRNVIAMPAACSGARQMFIGAATRIESQNLSSEIAGVGASATGIITLKAILIVGANAGNAELYWGQNTSNATATTLGVASVVQYRKTS